MAPTIPATRAAAATFCAILAGCASAVPAPDLCAGVTAVVFGAGTISGDDREAAARLTADGQSIFFGRISPGRDRGVILVARRDAAGGWAPADTLPFSGRYVDRDPFPSADGTLLLFASDRPAPGKTDQSDDLWVSERRDDGSWGEPRRLPAPINSPSAEWSPVLTATGDLYFASGRPSRLDGMNVYRARRRTGGFMDPELLPEPVNTRHDEAGVWVDAAERLIVLARAEVDSLWGGRESADLFQSRRRGDRWDSPRRLEAGVNTEVAESAPALTPDGATLLFTRDARRRVLEELEASMDIYAVPLACAAPEPR